MNIPSGAETAKMPLQEEQHHLRDQQEHLAENLCASVPGHNGDVQSSSSDGSHSDGSGQNINEQGSVPDGVENEENNDRNRDTVDMEHDAHFLFAGTTNWCVLPLFIIVAPFEYQRLNETVIIVAHSCFFFFFIRLNGQLPPSMLEILFTHFCRPCTTVNDYMVAPFLTLN